MKTLPHLFRQNRAWAAAMERSRPGFFRELAQQQAPDYLWIGCSDSRVPANEIVGLLPGELFVHRNVANLVVPNDANCQSVLEYAIGVLKVEHVIVCGHYGCGGVALVAEHQPLGRAATWLSHLALVRDRYAGELALVPAGPARNDRLCELNVITQVQHVCESPAVKTAWANGQSLSVHGWIYRLEDGLLRDFGLTVSRPDELQEACAAAVRARPDIPT